MSTSESRPASGPASTTATTIPPGPDIGAQPRRPSQRRPRASVPTMRALVDHWHTADDCPARARERFDYIGTGEPFCFRCGWLAPEVGRNPWDAGYLERAHLVDYSALRDADQLHADGPGNIVPLCHWCHRGMPVFGIGDRGPALAWLDDGAKCPELRQLISDAFQRPPSSTPRPVCHARRVDRVLARIAEDHLLEEVAL